MAYCCTFSKDFLKLEKVLWAINYGVTMDLQKKFFVEPAESFPQWLKITLWKEIGYLVQKYKVAIKKNNFADMFSNTFPDFISDMGVTNHRHYDR